MELRYFSNVPKVAFQVSLLSSSEQFMTSDEIAKAIENVDAALDILKGCLRIGSATVPPPLSVKLLILSETCSLIQYGLKFGPEKLDPVAEKLDKISNDFKELDKMTITHFNELRSFITKNQFSAEVITQVATLRDFRNDFFKDRNQQSIDNFRVVYEQNKPLNMAYTLMSLLEQQFTNPLVMAMAAEKGKTKATFEKWRNVILAIFNDYIMIEATAAGLFHNNDLHNCLRIAEQLNEAVDFLKKLEEEYKKDQGYWVEMRDYLEPFITSHTDWSNVQKAEAIAKKMAGFITEDHFYVVVFNEGTWQQDYSYLCANESSQIIGCWRKGGCCAFVYRSLTARNKSPSDFKLLTDRVEACEKVTLLYETSLDNMIKTQLVEAQHLPDYGFISLIYGTKIVAIEVTERNREPGRYLTVTMKNKSGDRTYKYNLIAAFE